MLTHVRRTIWSGEIYSRHYSSNVSSKFLPVLPQALCSPPSGSRGASGRPAAPRSAHTPPAIKSRLGYPEVHNISKPWKTHTFNHSCRLFLATLRIRLEAKSWHIIDSGIGRKIPAIWHGADAYPGGFIPET